MVLGVGGNEILCCRSDLLHGTRSNIMYREACCCRAYLTAIDTSSSPSPPHVSTTLLRRRGQAWADRSYPEDGRALHRRNARANQRSAALSQGPLGPLQVRKQRRQLVKKPRGDVWYERVQYGAWYDIYIKVYLFLAKTHFF